MAASFNQTITFLTEMLEGGAIPDAHSHQYQRWHCSVSAEHDAASGNPNLDNTMDAFIDVETTFFERASYRYPASKSVALITGKFFITTNGMPKLRVRAEPIRVYVRFRYSLHYYSRLRA